MRGGIRKGAGRRPELEGQHTVSVSLDDKSELQIEHIQRISKQIWGRQITRSEVIRWALKNCSSVELEEG